MAKRDILKEAIADAKTVKETAIANAKAALEEAFTPQLKSMLATKLEEMDKEDMDEAEDMRHKDDKGPDRGAERKSLDSEPRYNKKKDLDEEKDDMDEEINLDEILAEIEEMDKKDIDEDARTDAEEEGYEDGMEDEKEDMEDKEDEEIDLEDMTDEDLKDFIEDVIADMVASGELEAGENFEEEGEEEEVDVDVEDDVDVEISEAKKKDKEDDKDKMEEAVGNPISTSVKAGSKNKYDEDFMKAVKDDLAKLMSKVGLKEEDEIDEAAPGTPTSTSVKAGSKNKYDEDFMKAVKDDLAKLMSKVGLKEEELDEAYNTIESLKSDLNEVNLLNAKLLYTNKIFKAKTLTESQKVKVLGAFDKAGTVKETKLVFETLNEGLKTKKTSMIKESLGSASRVSRSVNAKKPIIETDPMVERFKKLAGIK
jgi:hypothetical protein